MALKYVELPLFADSYYEYSTALQDNSYILEFYFVERVQSYFFSLYDADRNPIVLGERMVPSYPMFKDYALFPLTGWIWMESIAELEDEAYLKYPDKINEYYRMYYVYDDGV
jgi:hypothetical protein